MSKTIRHKFKLSKRSGELVLIEEADRVLVEFHFTAIGDFGDAAEIEAALYKFIQHYDSDPRPLVCRNPKTGEVATVIGDSNGATCLIQGPENLN